MNAGSVVRLTVVSAIVAALTLVGSVPGEAALRTAPKYRPDGLLALGTGQVVGDNVYNATGTGQVRKVSLQRGKTAVFRWHRQNDGSAKDELCLRGAGGDANFKIRFFLGTKDITAGVVAWSFMKTEPAHQAYTVVMKVTAKAGAHIGAVRKEILTVTSTSSGLADTVLARVDIT